MNLAAAFLVPIAALLSAVGLGDERRDDDAPTAQPANEALAEVGQGQDAAVWPIGILQSFEPDTARQVHIEQRMTIRISPRAATPMPRDMFVALPQRTIGPRFTERRIGKCLPVSGIVGVEPNGSSNLILFMRDRRMINAALDRSCRSRSFYSGFYLSPSEDGMICVDRDTLHSRSGSTCKLSSIRQLVDAED